MRNKQLSLAQEFREHIMQPLDECVEIIPSPGQGSPYTYYGPIHSVEIVVKSWLIVDPQATIQYPAHRRCIECHTDQGSSFNDVCLNCSGEENPANYIDHRAWCEANYM